MVAGSRLRGLDSASAAAAPNTASPAPSAGELTSRRGLIVSTEVKGATATIEGEVPLAETFGYSTDLRSMTQGQGTFTMEFSKYRRVPMSIQAEIVAETKKQQALVGAK